MESYDVLIIGGGPAGSSCAWGLRHSGLRVAILDKHVFPRDKVCGGWITPGVLEELKIDRADYARDRLLQPITGFRVGCIGEPPLKCDYEEQVSYGIRRREFDDYLLRRSGARLLLGEPVHDIQRAAGGWIVNERIRAHVLIGAGGHFCPVARFMGAHVCSEAAVVAQEVEFEMNKSQLAACRVAMERPELYFCRDMKGYGWCFRKHNVLNVGLGRADLNELSTHVSGFTKFLSSTGRISSDLPRFTGHAYLLAIASTRAVASDDLLLIGDAAGLAYPYSGEGIRPAVQSGLHAAGQVVQRLSAGSKLHPYRAQSESKRQSAVNTVTNCLPQRWVGSVARRLLRRPWFVRNVVLNQWFLSAE
jgi:menaquinone-9 beta-reductase